MKKTLYGLPRKVIFCKKSLMSNQRPVSTQEFSNNLKKKKTHLSLIKRVFQIVGVMLNKKKILTLRIEKKN